MHKVTRTTAAFGAAGLIAAGLAAAAPANAAETIFLIKVTEVQTDYVQTWDHNDLPEAGDYFVFQSNLRQAGHRVGKDAGKCTFKRIYGDSADPTSAKLRCDVTFHFFNRGTIHAIGTRTIDWDDLVNSSVNVKLPVVNGTNSYDGAGGIVRVNQINEKKSRLTFRLTGVS